MVGDRGRACATDAGAARGRKRRLARCCFACNLVFGGFRLQFLELKLHLVDEPSRLLRTLAVELALELLNLQLEMGDHRLAGRYRGAGVARLALRLSRLVLCFGRLSLGTLSAGFGCGTGFTLRQSRRALGQEQRRDRRRIGRQHQRFGGFEGCAHTRDGITSHG